MKLDRIGIIGHIDPAQVQATLAHVVAKLCEQFPRSKILLSEALVPMIPTRGCEVISSLERIAKESDVIVSVGGDGTMLLAARAIARADHHAVLLGVNAGKLGFLSEHPPVEVDALVEELAANALIVEERIMLNATVQSESGKPVEIRADNLDASRIGATTPEARLDALNEVVIDNYGSTRMLTLEVFVNGAQLGVIRADGIIVSTPTGSTGYSVSAGGPIVEPTSPVLQITPIAPHSLNVRPIIVNSTATVRVRARAEETPTVLVVADGQEQVIAGTPAEISVRTSDKKLRLLRRRERSYFDLLRSKLYWSADSRDAGRR